MKLLITDDDNGQHLLLKHWLTKRCSIPEEDITSAYSGEEAVALVRDAATHGQRFDFISMDHQMGGIFGDEATLKIRDIERDFKLPESYILSCSATYVGPFLRANKALSKPIDSKRFITLILAMKEATAVVLATVEAAVEKVSATAASAPTLVAAAETERATAAPVAAVARAVEDVLATAAPTPSLVAAAETDGTEGALSRTSPRPLSVFSRVTAAQCRAPTPPRTAPPPEARASGLAGLGLFHSRSPTPAHPSPYVSPRCSPTVGVVTTAPPGLGFGLTLGNVV